MILDWRKFVLRSDVKNLSLEEQRRKFLKEQLYYDNLLSEQQQRQHEFYMSQMNSKGGAASGGGFTGNASDGPIAGATVTSNVGTTTTDTLGNFTFKKTPTSEITVTGGTDSITGVAFTGELKGFPQYKTVSPLTTLAFYLKEEVTNLTTDTAVDLLFASSSALFGVELALEDKDVMLNQDYTAESILTDNQKAIAAQSIATYLESVTEVVGGAVRGADEAGGGESFTTNEAKVQGYKSIARQMSRNVELTRPLDEINVVGLFRDITLPDGQEWPPGRFIEESVKETISTNLTNVKSELGILARSEAFTANYLTTQIQAVNRGAKEDYAVDAKLLAKGGEEVEFDSINVMISKSTGSLAQIEAGKANENTREVKRDEIFYTLGAMTFTQNNREGEPKTISGNAFVSGSMKAISSTTEAFTEEDALTKYIIKPNGDSLSLQGATNYNSTLKDVTAKQNSPSPENIEENKLIQLTLDSRTYQIKTYTLIDAPATTHIFPTGNYKLSMEGTDVTQILTIIVGSPNKLSFGSIEELNISDGITVIPNTEDPTKFVVNINGVSRTPEGGTAFSGNGNNSTLSFNTGDEGNAYTITYLT